MLKNYHSRKLTSRVGVLNPGVFYPMNVFVRYFVDKPFCGEDATKGSMTCQKVRVYSLVPWQHRGVTLTHIRTLKIYGLKVNK